MIVGTEEQVATGVTGFPSPVNDMDAEWVWHGFLLLMAMAAVEDQTAQVDVLEIDSKAMRRVKQTQSMVMVVQNGTVQGAGVIDVAFGSRILFAA